MALEFDDDPNPFKPDHRLEAARHPRKLPPIESREKSSHRDWLIAGVLMGVAVTLVVVLVVSLIQSPTKPLKDQTIAVDDGLNDRQRENETLVPLNVTDQQILDCFAASEFGRRLDFELIPGSDFQYMVKPELFTLAIDRNLKGQIVSANLFTILWSPKVSWPIEDEMLRCARFEVAFQQLAKAIAPSLEMAEFKPWLGEATLTLNSGAQLDRADHRFKVHVATFPGSGSMVTLTIRRDPTYQDDE